MLTTDNAKLAALDLIAKGLGGGKALRANGFLSIDEAYAFERRRIRALAAAYRVPDTGLAEVVDQWIPPRTALHDVSALRDAMRAYLAVAEAPSPTTII